jgi:hypothetical protein
MGIKTFFLFRIFAFLFPTCFSPHFADCCNQSFQLVATLLLSDKNFFIFRQKMKSLTSYSISLTILLVLSNGSAVDSKPIRYRNRQRSELSTPPDQPQLPSPLNVQQPSETENRSSHVDLLRNLPLGSLSWGNRNGPAANVGPFSSNHVSAGPPAAVDNISKNDSINPAKKVYCHKFSAEVKMSSNSFIPDIAGRKRKKKQDGIRI